MRGEDFSLLIVGILLLFIGILIRYLIGKRRFKRRTIGGMQLFKRYSMSLIIPVIEGLGIIISFIMILSGTFLVILYYVNY
jgi:hypothetical protein